MLIGNAALRTSGQTGHAADAIRVAYKIRISHINVHRAGFGTKLAVDAGGRVAANLRSRPQGVFFATLVPKFEKAAR